jgi:DNA-binding response OmpR family regulator
MSNPAPPAGESHPAPARQRYRVLVVDDHDAGRYALARALAAAGFLTLEAAGGAEALALLEASARISAVVLDVHLPDLHGFEVCRAIRKQAPTMPVVHVSAVYVDPPYRIAGNLAGANEYLVGPVDPDELAALLDRLLDGRAPAAGLPQA